MTHGLFLPSVIPDGDRPLDQRALAAVVQPSPKSKATVVTATPTTPAQTPRSPSAPPGRYVVVVNEVRDKLSTLSAAAGVDLVSLYLEKVKSVPGLGGTFRWKLSADGTKSKFFDFERFKVLLADSLRDFRTKVAYLQDCRRPGPFDEPRSVDVWRWCCG